MISRLNPDRIWKSHGRRRFVVSVVFVVFIVDSLQRGFPFVLEVSEDCLLQNILRLCQIFSFGSFGHDSVQIFFAMLLFLSVSMASAASASAARWCNAVFEIHAAVNHRWERKRAREREQVREGGRESWHENRYLEKGGIWKRPFSVFVGLVRSCSIIFFSSLEKMLVFFFFDSRSRSKSFWNKTKKKKSRLLKKT